MNVKIRKTVDHGHSDERIILDVLEDEEIGNYMILDTTYAEGDVSNKVRHPYWFPDQQVKKGDIVVLYTNKGPFSTIKNSDGSTSYFFHWGLDSNVWNNDGDCALLVHIDEWEHHKVSIPKK